VFEFSLSNPSAAVDYTFTFTNGTAGVLITLPLRTVTVPAGATTGTVSVTTADTIENQ
jgi:hypothetical protein